MLTAQVRPHRGAPALFVNDRPHTGLMFWAYNALSPRCQPGIADFRDAGVHLLSVCSELTDGLAGPGVYDFRAFDEQMRTIIDINPQALVMPRVGLIPTQEWLDANPRERMVHFDLETNKMIARGGAHVSFNSPKWHAMMEPALRAFVLHVEQHFGENVAGYHVAGGDCGEWSYIWAERLSDFSEPQQEAYRWWLAERYKTDAAVQAAWGDPNATLAGAEVPRDRVRPPGAAPSSTP